MKSPRAGIALGVVLSFATSACLLFTSVAELGGGGAPNELLAEGGQPDGGGPPDGNPSSDATAADASPMFADPVVLAPAQTKPAAVVMDNDNAYWMTTTATMSGLSRATRRPPGPVGAGLSLDGTAFAYRGRGLALSARGLFWVVPNGVGSAAIASLAPPLGATALTLLAGVGDTLTRVDDIAAFGTSLYFIVSPGVGTPGLQSMGDDGTGRVGLGYPNSRLLLVDATSLYFVNAAQVMRLAKTGGTADVVADMQVGVRGMALSSGRLYWVTDGGQVLTIDAAATVGMPTVLADKQAAPSAIAVDSTNVYWTNSADGTVMQIAQSGGTPQVLARNQSTPALLVADEAGLCWVNANGDVIGLLRR